MMYRWFCETEGIVKPASQEGRSFLGVRAVRSPPSPLDPRDPPETEPGVRPLEVDLLEVDLLVRSLEVDLLKVDLLVRPSG